MKLIYRARLVSLFLLSTLQPAIGCNYTTFSETAFGVLQQYYNHSNGLWPSATWFHSPQCLQVTADLAALDTNVSSTAKDTIANTHSLAWHHNPAKPNDTEAGRWLGEFYDNEGYWAMAWIKAYDITKDVSYLQTAAYIFEDMAEAWSPCGGIWWNRDHHSVATIAQGLFLEVGASLANRVDDIVTHNGTFRDRQYYLSWAVKEWDFIAHSGLISPENLLKDGLYANCTLKNATRLTTYNQGVVIGGLVELNRAAPNSTYLPQAQAIADASLKHFAGNDSIITDVCEPHCGLNGDMFKGIFIRNLQQLQDATPEDRYKTAFRRNADSVWQNDRNSRNQLGQVWQGPPTTVNAVTHAAGMDALIAALSIC